MLDIPGELRQDPIFARTGGERVGRDGCRVPLPWSGTEAPFGFGPAGTPWLPQPASWADLTVGGAGRRPGFDADLLPGGPARPTRATRRSATDR